MEKDLETTEIIETNSEEVMEQNDGAIETVENSGMNSGVAMLIGGALALSAVAGVKKLKKVWQKRKKKEDSSEKIVDDTFYDDEELANDESNFEEV